MCVVRYINRSIVDIITSVLGGNSTKFGVSNNDVCDDIQTLQTYLGIELIKRTCIRHSLSGKNTSNHTTSSYKLAKYLFTAIVEVLRALIIRNMVSLM